MRVVLVADLAEWVLGDVAAQLARRLAGKLQIELLYSRAQGFPQALAEAQARSDVVHFLSSTDSADFGKLVYLPCVATLWHMVDWTAFDRGASRIDALFVGSAQWQERVAAHVDPRIGVARLGYGVDTRRFARGRDDGPDGQRSTDPAAGTLTFGFAGSGWSNEGNRKGLDRLWPSLRRLREAGIGPCRLRIVGPHWPETTVPPDLRVITRLEWLRAEELPAFYSGLDYYLCTSREEGVPYPVLEAMACESVVVSTPVGVVPEIVQSGENGFICRQEAVVEDVLAAVARTAHDLEERRALGRRARQSVVSGWSWDRAVDPTVHLATYESAIRFFGGRPADQRRRLARTARWSTRYLTLARRLRVRQRLRSARARLRQAG